MLYNKYMKLFVLKLENRPTGRVICRDDFLTMYHMFHEHPGFYYRTLNNPDYFTVGTQDPKNWTEMLEFKLKIAGVNVRELKEMGSNFAHQFWLDAKPFL